MGKTGKINKYIIGSYFFLLLISIFLAWKNEGPKAIIMLIFLFYMFTGAIFGFIEAFIILKCYIDSKKKTLLVWLVPVSMYIAGSIYWAFFSNFVL